MGSFKNHCCVSASNSTLRILLKSKNKIAAFRLQYNGKLIDTVIFDAEDENGPNVLADSILGNYNEDLFQLIIVDIKNKMKLVEKKNDGPFYCE